MKNIKPAETRAFHLNHFHQQPTTSNQQPTTGNCGILRPVTTQPGVSTGAFGQQFTRESILQDYRTAYRSRQASIIGRKEVLTGKAKFGIFGDGKELAQLAMARVFRTGDIRSGY